MGEVAMSAATMRENLMIPAYARHPYTGYVGMFCACGISRGKSITLQGHCERVAM